MTRSPGLRSRDFQRVNAGGSRARAGCIKVTALVDEGSPSRLGLAVSRRCGNAVVRNRVRRRIKSAWAAIEVPEGTLAVIGGSAGCASAPYPELVDNVREALVVALGAAR